MPFHKRLRFMETLTGKKLDIWGFQGHYSLFLLLFSTPVSTTQNAQKMEVGLCKLTRVTFGGPLLASFLERSMACSSLPARREPRSRSMSRSGLMAKTAFKAKQTPSLFGNFWQANTAFTRRFTVVALGAVTRSEHVSHELGTSWRPFLTCSRVPVMVIGISSSLALIK